MRRSSLTSIGARWFERAHGNRHGCSTNVEPEIYDLLEIPLRWELGDSAASRSRTRIPRREIYYHDGPFLKRSDVSLEAEFARAENRRQESARPRKFWM